ncbi:MAG TPA: hypothetical protein VF159_01915 [Gemmatimonadaceae bacterium]
MQSSKVAAVMSGLSAPIKSKPMKVDSPAPRAKTPTTPGLGAKMREETSRSLEKMLKQGAFTTGLEGLLKHARDGLPMQATRPAVSWGDVHRGVAQQQAQNVRVNPAPLPPARTFRDAMPTTPTSGGGRPPPPSPARGGGGGGGMFGNFKMPRMGRTMGLVGLGALGAGLYGLHKQNEEDRQRRALVYAPLPGSVMQ